MFYKNFAIRTLDFHSQTHSLFGIVIVVVGMLYLWCTHECTSEMKQIWRNSARQYQSQTHTHTLAHNYEHEHERCPRAWLTHSSLVSEFSKALVASAAQWSCSSFEFRANEKKKIWIFNKLKHQFRTFGQIFTVFGTWLIKTTSIKQKISEKNTQSLETLNKYQR